MDNAVANKAGAQKTKRSLWKVLLLAINILLFLSGLAFFLITKLGMLQNVTPGEAKEEPRPIPKVEHKVLSSKLPLVAVPLQPFIVNLSGDNGRHYLRLTIQAQVWGEETKTEIEKRIAEIQNQIIFLLSSKSFADIGTVQGKYQLQEEIKKTLNEVIGQAAVEKIFFTEFIVQ